MATSGRSREMHNTRFPAVSATYRSQEASTATPEEPTATGAETAAGAMAGKRRRPRLPSAARARPDNSAPGQRSPARRTASRTVRWSVGRALIASPSLHVEVEDEPAAATGHGELEGVLALVDGQA